MIIDWANFTPLASLVGGGLIGLAAFILLLWGGKVAGISGIVGGLFKFEKDNMLWRMLFVLGLILSPWVYRWFAPLPVLRIEADSLTLIVAGVLVGFGTQLGSGCTSGHGVCGVSRLSVRSLVATLCFMGAGFLTVFVLRHLL